MTIGPATVITPLSLKAMEEKVRLEAVGELVRRMDPIAVQSISYFRWNRRTLIGTTSLSSGSCFFLAFGEKLFLVTAAHVFDGYRAAKEISGQGNILRHIDNTLFDPEARLICYSRELDIATFDFSYAELIAMNKQAIQTSPWPPPAPSTDSAVFFGGFPGHGRFWLGSDAISFSLYMGHMPLTTINERQMTFRFDRGAFMPTERLRTPPPGIDLGGMSGGPLLVPLGTETGEWHYCLGGVIIEAQTSKDFEKSLWRFERILSMQMVL